jgi:hypothetical protein
MPSAYQPTLEQQFQWPWQGVDFSPAYVCYLLYMFVISSYVLNIGQAVMGIALLAITFGTRERWKFPVPMFFLTAFFLVVALTFKTTQYRSYTNQPLIDFLGGAHHLCGSDGAGHARVRFFSSTWRRSRSFQSGAESSTGSSTAPRRRDGSRNHLLESNYARDALSDGVLCLATLLAEKSKLMRQAAVSGRWRSRCYTIHDAVRGRSSRWLRSRHVCAGSRNRVEGGR